MPLLTDPMCNQFAKFAQMILLKSLLTSSVCRDLSMLTQLNGLNLISSQLLVITC